MKKSSTPLLRRTLALRFALLIGITGAFSVALTLGGLYRYYRDTMDRETAQAAAFLGNQIEAVREDLLAHASILAHFEGANALERETPEMPGVETMLLARLERDVKGYRLLGVGTRALWARLGFDPATVAAMFASVESTHMVRLPDGSIHLVAAVATGLDLGSETRLALSQEMDIGWLARMRDLSRAEIALCDGESSLVAASFSVGPVLDRPLCDYPANALLDIRGEPYGFRLFPLPGGGSVVPSFAVFSPAGPIRSWSLRLGLLQVVAFGGAFLAFLLLHLRTVNKATADLRLLAQWSETCLPDNPTKPPSCDRFRETELLSTTMSALVDRLTSAHAALTVRKEALERQVQEKTEEIYESHRMMDEILGNMPQALVLLDPGGAIAYANPVARRDFGCSAGESPPPGLAPGPCVARGRAEQSELARGERIFLVTCAPLDAHGRVLVVANDVTSRRSLEKQLMQTQKIESVSRLAGGVAHEFNNALASILPGVDVLRLRVEDEKSRGYLDAIENAAMRGADVVRKLLAFSRAGETVPRPMDLNKTVETALSLLRPAAKSVAVAWEPMHPLPRILGDDMQIQQLVFNLGLNAIDAVEGRGAIRFETWADAGKRHVYLSVSDTGPGIPPEAAEHIFDPFFTTKEPGKGTGLGLAIAYAVVEHHRGRIRLVPQAEGARFEVEFPALEPGRDSALRGADDIVIGG